MSVYLSTSLSIDIYISISWSLQHFVFRSHAQYLLTEPLTVITFFSSSHRWWNRGRAKPDTFLSGSWNAQVLCCILQVIGSWPQNQNPLLAVAQYFSWGSDHEWVSATPDRGRQRWGGWSWSWEPGKRQKHQRQKRQKSKRQGHPCGDWRWNRVSSDQQQQACIRCIRWISSDTPQFQPAHRIWKLWKQLRDGAREWNWSTQNLQQL